MTCNFCIRNNIEIIVRIKNYNIFLIGFPFAKLLRNFCGTKRKFFFLCTSVLREKNNNLRNHSQKSFRTKLPYSAFAKLKFCAIPQLKFLRNSAISQKSNGWWRCVFLIIQFWNNLVLEYTRQNLAYIFPQMSWRGQFCIRIWYNNKYRNKYTWMNSLTFYL